MKKVIGVVLAIIGFGIILVGKIPNVFEKISFLPKIILENTLSIGVIVLILGIVFLVLNRSSGKVGSPQQEIPIYSGKQIVGYRRS